MDLLQGITEDERDVVLTDLDLSHAAAWAENETPEHLEQHGLVWRSFNETDGPTALRAHLVDQDPRVEARFYGYAFAPLRPGRSSAGWYLSGYVGCLASGEHVIRQLAIEPEHDQQTGISTDVLRAIKPADILAKVRAYLGALPAAIALDAERGEPVTSADRLEADRAARLLERRRGRPPRSDELLERIARLCCDFHFLHGRGVLKRVVEHETRRLGLKRSVPLDTIKGQVRAARVAGFLAPGHRGKSSFEPGPRLKGRWQPPKPTPSS